MPSDMSDYSVAQAKADALKNFALLDKHAVPLNVNESRTLEETLKTGSAIIVTGYVPPNAIRFAVNLLCRTPGNVALHFNPRLDRDYVVRNTRVGKYWETEETCTPLGLDGNIFRRNVYFHLMIFCSPNEFQIAVNGEHFCAFAYRMPPAEVTAVEVDGDIDEVKTRQTCLYIYPDPKICRPSRNLALSNEVPSISENLKLPVTVGIPGGSLREAQILIKGRLKLLPHSFYVNLQRGRTVYPHPEIALHLNPRFLFGNRSPCVVMNCWTDGKWCKEERHEGHLSWAPGREFLLSIRFEDNAFTIWLGGKMIGTFLYRLEPTIVDTLRITGDIVLHELAITRNNSQSAAELALKSEKTIEGCNGEEHKNSQNNIS